MQKKKKSIAYHVRGYETIHRFFFFFFFFQFNSYSQEGDLKLNDTRMCHLVKLRDYWPWFNYIYICVYIYVCIMRRRNYICHDLVFTKSIATQDQEVQEVHILDNISISDAHRSWIVGNKLEYILVLIFYDIL